MKIALIEPFFTGSHRRWAEELQRFSTHEIQLFTLKGRHWKWRMHGGAVSLAKQFTDSGYIPDLILATDMLDLSLFLSLTRRITTGIPVAIYFHENQLTYPWSPTDQDTVNSRDNHYAFINYSSALCADRCFFNSSYHLESFTNALPGFLKQFPDDHNLGSIEEVKSKSSVLYLGIDLSDFIDLPLKPTNATPRIVWNHRWEYDKSPEEFFRFCHTLKDHNHPFQLYVLGEELLKRPAVFKEKEVSLKDNIGHFGYAKSREDYIALLRQGDILPVTSIQDFFGGSVVEGIASGCIPLLPNRLAYPEHIPEHLQDLYLYKDFDDLLIKYEAALENPLITKHKAELQEHVMRYDWKNIGPMYDEVFSEMKR